MLVPLTTHEKESACACVSTIHSSVALLASNTVLGPNSNSVLPLVVCVAVRPNCPNMFLGGRLPSFQLCFLVMVNFHTASLLRSCLSYKCLLTPEYNVVTKVDPLPRSSTL